MLGNVVKNPDNVKYVDREPSSRTHSTSVFVPGFGLLCAVAAYSLYAAPWNFGPLHPVGALNILAFLPLGIGLAAAFFGAFVGIWQRNRNKAGVALRAVGFAIGLLNLAAFVLIFAAIFGMFKRSF